MFAAHTPVYAQFQTFAELSAVPKATWIWGMCSKHCKTSRAHLKVLQNLVGPCLDDHLLQVTAFGACSHLNTCNLMMGLAM